MAAKLSEICEAMLGTLMLQELAQSIFRLGFYFQVSEIWMLVLEVLIRHPNKGVW